MAKLTDTQAVLLSTASQRADGSLLPPPDTLGAINARIRKAIATLVSRSLADEVAGATVDRAWRSEGDRHWGAVITDAGRAAIGVEPAPGTAALAPTPNEAKRPKSALVLDMLRRGQGATLAELVDATGWLPHTTRAALSGLRKKGHTIAKGRRDDVTCYTVAAAA